MLNFNNIEDLFEKLGDGDGESVSVVANKDLAFSIVKELLNYNDVILKYANVDDYEYDKEYIVSLHDDVNLDSWDIAIDQIYNYEKEIYLGTDGYVLFHEDTNSKAMIDMQNNENIELAGHDWFIVAEDIDEYDSEDKDNDDSDTEVSTKVKEVYRVNGKEVDKDTYLKMVDKINRDIDKDINREFSDMFGMLYRPYLYDEYETFLFPIRIFR